MANLCLPPASFSIRKEDENFCLMWREVGPTFRVYLDDKHQTKVIAYDCHEGWVRRYRTGADGRIIIALARDSVEEETLYGTVTVAWGPDRT